MNRLEAIQLIIEHLSDGELLIHANGAISRESFYCKDRLENFYLLGSMGLASSVGLGVAIHLPQRRVIVLDGDGNLLMGFGNLALIGALKPKNLIHLVIDNRVYGTTGNQPTISPFLPFSTIAQASGYRTAQAVQYPEELIAAFSPLLHQPGPHFLHIKVNQEVPRICGRIPYSAREIKERFMSTFD